MQAFGIATLEYVAKTKASNGSPTVATFTRVIKVKEIKTFSLNYYLMNDVNIRSMRNSKNLVVPKWCTEDILKDNLRYELMYVSYKGLKYHIKNILKYYKSSLRMILDIEELK